MPYELPPDGRAERRIALWRRASFALVAILVAALAYLAYVGFVGSGQAIHPPSPSRDCRTPAMAFGWKYEAVNYDLALDASLLRVDDPLHCPPPSAIPGDELVSADGVRLAGWYIPGESGTGPAGPTVVLAHGHGVNKSAMLSHAALLHADYNLLLFDFRNHGQSEEAMTTVGVRERADLRAAIDWLEEHKRPVSVGVLGVSMGGATAINQARADQRVKAVVLDSTHATLASALQARIERAGFPLALPGAWSILLGGLLRTGEDMSTVDPVQAVERYGDRPLLIVAGGHDLTIGPRDADDLLAAATEAGNANAELRICANAGHAQPIEACPDDYRDWVLGFFARTLDAPS